MDQLAPSIPSEKPPEMFNVVQHIARTSRPRLGRLVFPGRNAIETPHYLANTSRGAVPHLTPDIVMRDTLIKGVYASLEDFIEHMPNKTPPLYNVPPLDGSTSLLRQFIALPEPTVSVLGARRVTPVISPAANPNTASTVSVCTSVGFKKLSADDYARAVEKLGADIVIALGDIPFGRSSNSKRIEKATDRNVQWLQDHVALRAIQHNGRLQPKLFAPLLPIPCTHQQFYLDAFTGDVRDDISGLVLYNIMTIDDLPTELEILPRLGFTSPSTPHDVLDHIRRGIDILTIPFIDEVTDAGIALHFYFSEPKSDPVTAPASAAPLGTDMWLPEHAINMSPLAQGCTCYACTNHHRAYVQHLLNTKEMLGWVLLQIHNHHVMDLFFKAIRQSIEKGTYDIDIVQFSSQYEEQFPQGSGKGPRVRGYQYKSEGPGEVRKNKAPFAVLNDEG